MKSQIVILLLLAGILQIACANSNISTPIATIPNGKIEGIYKKTNGGRTFMQFHGIPYAKPPIGKFRFAPPQPIEPWTGIWVANSSYTCIHLDHHDESSPEGRIIGTEDCLYVNVHVPGEKIDQTKDYDVIVHIHGGGFMFGNAHFYAHPNFLMNREVVFVTFNYRLGIFGFLSTKDKYLPGNLGMKDQVMALKWIQQNIKSFGGNPGSVTLTGFSAGSASVQFHLLSPMSKGLFHKAISASGGVLEPWALHEAPLEKAKQLGKAVGCTYENSKDYLECLRRRPASQIIETVNIFQVWMHSPLCTFAPVVDDVAEEPFLPEHPYKLLTEGKVVNDVPWIASLTTAEGLYPVAQLLQREEYFGQLEKNWDKYIALILHYDLTVPEERMIEVGKKIKKHYLDDREASKETFLEITKIVGDRMFALKFVPSVLLHAKAIQSPVYFYQFDYTPEEIADFAQVMFGYDEKYGVCHGDDMLLIFKETIGSHQDAKMSDLLIDIWVSFAKTGKPTSVKDWKTVSKDTKDLFDYLYISSPDGIEMRTTKDLTGNLEFWNSLPILENEKLLNQQNIKTEL